MFHRTFAKLLAFRNLPIWMNLLKRERREPEVRAVFLLANQFNLCSPPSCQAAS